jgi:hypothetical protein
MRFWNTLLAQAIPVSYCVLELADWYITSDSVESISDSRRIVPHVARVALLALMLLVVITNIKSIFNRKLFWLQAAWVLFITIRYTVSETFSAQALLEVAVYATAPLSLWSCYIFTKNKYISLNFLSNIGIIMTMAYSLRIYWYKFTGIWIGVIARGGLDPTGPVATAGYMVLLFLSLALLGEFKYIKIVVAITALPASAMSMERSAQIEAILGFAVLIIYYMYSLPRKRLKLLCIAMIAVCMFSATYIAYADAITARWSDLSNPKKAGSGRAQFWAILYYDWRDGDNIVHLFGFGPGSVYTTTKAQWVGGVNHAHNEWLQMLYETGLTGLICYCVVVLLMYKDACIFAKKRSNGAAAALFGTSVVMCRSVFDYFFSNPSAMWYCIVIGSTLGATKLLSDKNTKYYVLQKSQVLGNANSVLR